MPSFKKIVTPNDLGLLSHQSGIAMPVDPSKGQFEVFPELGLREKNPECQLVFRESNGRTWQLRFIYYNGRMLDPPESTRNEYRITKGAGGDRPVDMCRSLACRVGDSLVFTKQDAQIAVEVAAVDRSGLEADMVKSLGVVDSPSVSITLDEILDTPRGQGFLVADDPEPDEGWVYVFENASMPGCSKIGYTKKKPEQRARELDTTSVAEPFVVTGSVRVKDPRRLESFIHQILEPRRVRKNREFFSIEPAAAIEYVNGVADIYSALRPIRS